MATLKPTLIEKPRYAPANNNRSMEITFRFRKHVGGNFAGLWELAVVRDGKVEQVISDADGLMFCIDNLSQIMENLGQ